MSHNDLYATRGAFECGCQPSATLLVEAERIRGTKATVLRRDANPSVVSHRITRFELSSPGVAQELVVGPQSEAQKRYAVLFVGVVIQHMETGSQGLPTEFLEQSWRGVAIVLVVFEDVEDRDVLKYPSTPLNTVQSCVNVPSEHDEVSFSSFHIERPKLEVKSTRIEYSHEGSALAPSPLRSNDLDWRLTLRVTALWSSGECC